MKRIVCFFLCAAFLCCAISGYGDKPEAELPIEPEVSEEPTVEPEPLRVVTTIFPVYDWVRQILGKRSDGAEITLLLDSGVDLHSYQPAVDDMVKISECDLFVYVGGESDQWAEDVLLRTANDHSVNLLDALGHHVKMEEHVEGMQDDGEDGEADEHIWLSLRNAANSCWYLAKALGEIDPENANSYLDNAAAYNEKLEALNEAYLAAVEGGRVKTVLFGSTSILTLTPLEVWLCVILSVVVVAVFILFYNKIFAVTFDESFARSAGTRADFYNLMIAVIVAVVIVLAMHLVGSLLISALVIFPALSAMRVFKSFRSVTVCSAALSVCCALLGMLISIVGGTPVGSTIVTVDIAAFAIFSLVGAYRGGIAA